MNTITIRMQPFGLAPSRAREVREAAGLTQLQVAAASGISIASIRLLEHGLASANTLRKIAEVLKCQPSDLIGTAEKK